MGENKEIAERIRVGIDVEPELYQQIARVEKGLRKRLLIGMLRAVLPHVGDWSALQAIAEGRAKLVIEEKTHV